MHESCDGACARGAVRPRRGLRRTLRSTRRRIRCARGSRAPPWKSERGAPLAGRHPCTKRPQQRPQRPQRPRRLQRPVAAPPCPAPPRPPPAARCHKGCCWCCAAGTASPLAAGGASEDATLDICKTSIHFMDRPRRASNQLARTAPRTYTHTHTHSVCAFRPGVERCKTQLRAVSATRCPPCVSTTSSSGV